MIRTRMLKSRSRGRFKKKRLRKTKRRRREFNIFLFLNKIEKELIEILKKRKEFLKKLKKVKNQRISDVLLFVCLDMSILEKPYYLIKLEVPTCKLEKQEELLNKLEQLTSLMKLLKITSKSLVKWI